MTAVVIYASLSKRHEDDTSIASQIAEIKAKLDPDVEIVGEFSDDGFSGSKRNRGPGLEEAITAAVAAADRHGEAELWAVASARFARGSGWKAEARALGGLYYELKAKAVSLRTVHDDDLVTNEMLVGFASSQASKYAKDLGAAVKRAKGRDAKAGKRLGGKWPLGYLDGEPGPEAPTIKRVFGLAESGMSDSQIARAVNGENLRTARGRPFDRRAIQAIVTNPTYAALVIHDDTEHEGHWTPLVDREVWRKIQRSRSARDLASPEQHARGRPAPAHLLSKLARCGACSGPLYATTSSYKRKDGSRAKQYQCREYRFSTGACDAKPFDAAVVDVAVLEGLHQVMPRFSEWIESIEDRHKAERDRLREAADKAVAELDAQRRTTQKAEDSWLRLDADDQEMLLPALKRSRAAFERAEVRAKASADAADSVPESAPHDKLLDFATALRQVIAGKLEGDQSVVELNVALASMFRSFTLFHAADHPVEEDTVLNPDGVFIYPNLNRATIGWLIAEGPDEIPEPPLEWLEAVAKSANPHQSPDKTEEWFSLPVIRA